MRLFFPLLLVLLAGCTTNDGLLGTLVDPTPAPGDDDDDAADDDDDDDDDDSVPDGFGEDGDGSYFFPQDRLLQIDITLSDTSWDSLEDDPYVYTPALVEIDGRRINDVAVRLRGRIGSFREIDEKPKWRLDFNRLVDGRRIEGLEALSLDNNVVDCSGLKQTLGTHILSVGGALGSRAGFAKVSVNGDDYGVYNTIEVQDDRYLKSRFTDGTGTLYDGAYTWFGEWDVRFADFTGSNSRWFELEEGTDVGQTDLDQVTEALEAVAAGAEFVPTVGALWDLDAFYGYVAAEYWIGQNDGYILNRNNNRVYFDPSTGLASFISYDLDYAFLWEPWNEPWSAPAGRFALLCFADETCLGGVRSAAASLLTILESADLMGTFNAWDAVTLEAAAGDRNDECSSNRVGQARDDLREWIEVRAAAMRAEWDIP
jgi:hypothetical protein